MNHKKKFFKILLTSLLIFITFNSIALGDSQFPSPSSYKYVNDYANVLDHNSINEIISIGHELETKTTAQAVIVIIPSTSNTPIEDYANKLFREWGIGTSQKDNGLLILLSLNDKQWRIEVGRGLEGVLPDLLTSTVMEKTAKPYFVEGNYSEGLLESYSIFTDYIAKEYGATLDNSLNITPPTQSSHRKNGLIFSGILLLLILLDLIFNRGRILSLILNIAFWNNYMGRGPRGGGSSGGGFGGFGGGSSNGGGSSGSW